MQGTVRNGQNARNTAMYRVKNCSKIVRHKIERSQVNFNFSLFFPAPSTSCSLPHLIHPDRNSSPPTQIHSHFQGDPAPFIFPPGGKKSGGKSGNGTRSPFCIELKEMERQSFEEQKQKRNNRVGGKRGSGKRGMAILRISGPNSEYFSCFLFTGQLGSSSIQSFTKANSLVVKVGQFCESCYCETYITKNGTFCAITKCIKEVNAPSDDLRHVYAHISMFLSKQQIGLTFPQERGE